MRISKITIALLMAVTSVINAAEEPIKETGQFPLNKATDLVLLEIGKHVSDRDLVHLAATSHRFKNLFHEDLKNRTELLRYWKKPIRSVFKQECTKSSGPHIFDVSSNGQLLALGENIGFILWDIATRQKSGPFERGEISESLIFSSPKPTQLNVLEITNENIRTWEVTKNGEGYKANVTNCLPIVCLNRSVAVFPDGRDVAVSPDGRYMAARFENWTVQIWQDNRVYIELQLDGTNPEGISAVTFSPNSKLLAIGDSEGNVTVWDLEKEEKIKLNTEKHSGQDSVSSVVFSPNNNQLAAGFICSTYRLPVGMMAWDLCTYADRAIKIPIPDNTCSIAFSPEGKIIACCDNSNIELREAATGKNLQKLSLMNSHPFSVAFSSDGKSLVTGHLYGNFRVWRAGDEVF